MREGVLAVLDALRSGLGAEAIGLFDDDRAETDLQELSRSPVPPSFWDAFGELPCAGIDWRPFYLSLKAEGRAEGPCGCGAGHRLQGFMVHGRWALLMVAPPVLIPGAAAVVTSAVKALAEKLPPARTPKARQATADLVDVDDGFAEALPRDRGAGAPLWWVRRRQ